MTWERPVNEIELRSKDLAQEQPKHHPGTLSSVAATSLTRYNGDPETAVFVTSREGTESYTLSVDDPRLLSPLYQQITAADTLKKAQRFVQLYGPLTEFGLSRPGAPMLHMIGDMDRYRRTSGATEIKYTYKDFERDRSSILKVIDILANLKDKELDDLISSASGDDQHIKAISLELRLETFFRPHDGAFTPVFSVKSPIHFSAFELFNGLHSGGEFRKCEYCGRLFGVGSVWGKSTRAKFCNDSHRNLAAQKKAKERTGSKADSF
jgi:hypothetical protein